MIAVLRSNWTLLFGMLLLMLGNGLQGTVLGVRGAMEGMSPTVISGVMSAYFVGLLIGARVAPALIAQVGHVRVFAALAGLISAAFILFPAAPNPWVWAVMRLIVGFSFCGVYVVAESWLNDRATNETRGQTMAAYMLVQMAGVIAAQALLNFGDPGGYTLFVIMTVLVSLATTPILLSASPAPAYQAAKRMTLRALFRVSPLGCVSTFALGAMYAALFGMAGVYGVEAGLSIGRISIFVASIYVGGFVMMYPIGWVSDRVDRRRLIVLLCVCGAGAALAASAAPFWPLVAATLIVGGAINTLYSLAIAYTNDFLQPEDMASASAGLLFLNGVGAVGGPLVVGLMMQKLGPGGFFLYLAVLLAAVGAYGLWRMTRRPARQAEESAPFAPVTMAASAVAVEATREAVIEQIAASHGGEGDDAPPKAA
ncbi:MAG: MFS transporter [Rhodobacteraceae bacterium]|nr:MAG: MFS transporter [Paracoccaceae bacterium]